jgi:hypothetical protein
MGVSRTVKTHLMANVPYIRLSICPSIVQRQTEVLSYTRDPPQSRLRLMVPVLGCCAGTAKTSPQTGGLIHRHALSRCGQPEVWNQVSRVGGTSAVRERPIPGSHLHLYTPSFSLSLLVYTFFPLCMSVSADFPFP